MFWRPRKVPVRGHTTSVRERYIITAAHCLPYLPPAQGGAHPGDRTHAEIIGPIGQQPTVWAECIFVDPIRDIAVLAEPDNQELPKQSGCIPHYG